MFEIGKTYQYSSSDPDYESGTLLVTGFNGNRVLCEVLNGLSELTEDLETRGFHQNSSFAKALVHSDYVVKVPTMGFEEIAGWDDDAYV